MFIFGVFISSDFHSVIHLVCFGLVLFFCLFVLFFPKGKNEALLKNRNRNKHLFHHSSFNTESIDFSLFKLKYIFQQDMSSIKYASKP